MSEKTLTTDYGRINRLSIKRIKARDRRTAAVHEAGHVIVAQNLGYLASAHIWPVPTTDPLSTRTWTGRCTTIGRLSPTHSRMIGVAGLVAEDVWQHRDLDVSSHGYWEDVFLNCDCMSATDWHMCGCVVGKYDEELTKSAVKCARLLAFKLWEKLISASRALIADTQYKLPHQEDTAMPNMEFPANASPLADPLLTPQAVCARYSLPYQTLSNWRHEGRGPRYIKLPGGRGPVRYRLSDLLEWEAMAFKHCPGGTEALAA